MIRTSSFLLLCVLCVSVARSAFGATTAPAAYRVYVSNERSNDVSVIDPAMKQVTATIPVGKRPRGIRVSHDGRFVYVALSGTPITPPGQKEDDGAPKGDRTADGIGVIDVAAGKLVEMLPAGSDPEQFAFSADSSRLYIANEDANAASVLDMNTRKVIKTIKVGSEPEGVTLSPDGRLVFVTSETTNDVHAIDTSTNEIVGHVKTAQRPRGVASTLR